MKGRAINIFFKKKNCKKIKFFDFGLFLVFWTTHHNFGHITQIWTFLATFDPCGRFWILWTLL